MDQYIHVSVRVKPLIEEEETEWEVIDDSMIHCLRTKEKYEFGTSRINLLPVDKVYSTDAKTSNVFEDAVKGLVSTTIQGINATVFAYGQTASGKTFTVRGNESSPGLIPLSIGEVFREAEKVKDRTFRIYVSFLELHNETINDLLVENSDKLEIKESMHGVFVKGLSAFEVTSQEQAMEFLEQGDARKKTAETKMNLQSSRSHTVFRISVESKPADALPAGPARVSQLNLVDLAGSEGVSRTKAEGLRLRYLTMRHYIDREGVTINKSLLALSNVIHRLSTSAGKHINFRDSKLTRLLQPALGGNSKTSIICTISQQKVNYQETVNTLLFGVKAKKIKNSAKVNVIVPDTHTRHQLALKEIQKQKEELSVLKEDNKQLRLTIVEKAATGWDSRIAECKCSETRAESTTPAGPELVTAEKFAMLRNELETSKTENAEQQKEIKEKAAAVVLLEEQIEALSRTLRSREREVLRLKEILTNAKLEYSPSTAEELKDIVVAAPEELSDQDISMVEEEDGIQLLDIVKKQCCSLSRADNGLAEENGKEQFDDLTPKDPRCENCVQLSAEIENLKQQMARYENSVQELERRNKEVERLRMEYAESNDAIKKLISEKVQLSVEHESWKMKCGTFGQEYGRMASRYYDMERKVAESKIQIDDLKNALTSVWKEVRSVQAKSKEISEKESTAGVVNEEIKKLRKDIENLNVEKSALALKVHNFKLHKCPRPEALRQDLSEKEDLIKRLRMEQNEWIDSRSRLTSEIELLQKKLKDKENQIEQASGKNSTLCSKLKALAVQNAELSEQLKKGIQFLEKGEVAKRKIYTVTGPHNNAYDGKKSTKRAKNDKTKRETDLPSSILVHLRRDKLSIVQSSFNEKDKEAH